VAAASPKDSSNSLPHTSYTVIDHVEVVMLLVATKIIFILRVCVWCISNPLTFHLELRGGICPFHEEFLTIIIYISAPSTLTINHKHSKYSFPSIYES
jgi:hypothetical protein